VPLALPRTRTEADIDLFAKVTTLAKASLILSHLPYADDDTMAKLNEALSHTPAKGLPWYITNNLEYQGKLPRYEAPTADDMALLQYTSGSTSTPKGVVISYSSL